jgi:hypothetical protein
MNITITQRDLAKLISLAKAACPSAPPMGNRAHWNPKTLRAHKLVEKLEAAKQSAADAAPR